MKKEILYTLDQLPQVSQELIKLIKPFMVSNKTPLALNNESSPEPLALSNESLVLSKEPLVMSKEPLVLSKEPLVVSKEPLVVSLSNHAVIITLTGDLGAGKTTLVKQLLKNWGVQDEVLSPTFTYVNCYKNDQGQKIYHFDLYRVSNSNQFSELGFDEYLHEPGAICLIEWPGVIAPVLEKMAVFDLEIEHVSDSSRKLIVIL